MFGTLFLRNVVVSELLYIPKMGLRQRRRKDLDRGKELLESNERLSYDEQRQVYRYLDESNRGSSVLFLGCLAFLHVVLVGVYAILLMRGMTLVYVPVRSRKAASVLMYYGAGILGFAAVCLAWGAAKIPVLSLPAEDIFDVVPSSADLIARAKGELAVRLRAIDQWERWMRAGAGWVPALASLLATFRWMTLVSSLEWSDVLLVGWQPAVHVFIFWVLGLMVHTSRELVGLRSSFYCHEKV